MLQSFSLYRFRCPFTVQNGIFHRHVGPRAIPPARDDTLFIQKLQYLFSCCLVVPVIDRVSVLDVIHIFGADIVLLEKQTDLF